MNNIIFQLVVGALLPVALHGAAATAPPSSPTVRIADGVVIGATTRLPEATAPVNKYLGIPYASPPVRFEPPSPAATWSQPLNATAFGPSCIQVPANNFLSNFSTSQFPVTGAQSEDCLYLNVFQPGGCPPSGGWPVMIWIYGGGLQFGSASLPIYDGSSFASFEDVILVSFNYRLSAFGFPGSPELPLNKTNLGFLDQRFALQWVQDNIHAFQGNASKVTLFGESSGGVSVDSMLAAPPASPLPFRAAIVQSGSAISQNLANIGSNASQSWTMLVAALNCSSLAATTNNNTNTNTLDCVRAKPADSIQAAIQDKKLNFGVVVDNTTFVPSSTRSRSSGRAANVPLLTGTVADEGTLFTYGETNFTAYVASLFGILPALVPLVTAAYPIGGNSSFRTEAQAIAQLYTEVGLQCPQALLANQSSAAGNPTWRYYYNATFPNLSPVPGLGVYHASELPLVFGTYPVNGSTAQQVALGKYMRGAWAQFARDPSDGPGWAKTTSGPGGADLGVLGADPSGPLTVINPQATKLEARCSLYEIVYNVLG